MAGVNSKFPTITSILYTALPQLDSAGMRGPAAAAHMTPGGVPVFISFDGKNDHAKLDPATGAASISFQMPYYTKMWARLAAAGAVDVQLIIEGA